MDSKVALVVPCYNEESRFPVEYWQDLLGTDTKISWVFVNDGSSDSTGALLREVVNGSDAKIVEYTKNLGKGNAIREGFLYALNLNSDCEFFGYVDSDGAFSKKDILQLTEKTLQISYGHQQKSIDALLSSRVALAGRQISRKPSRHYIGRVIATFLTSSWSDSPYDTQSGFKIFRNTNSFRTALQLDFKTSWFVDVELLTRIGILNTGTLDIWEEPLTSWRDVSGSKLSYLKIPKLIIEILIARRDVSQYVRVRNSSFGSH